MVTIVDPHIKRDSDYHIHSVSLYFVIVPWHDHPFSFSRIFRITFLLRVLANMEDAYNCREVFYFWSKDTYCERFTQVYRSMIFLVDFC